MSNMKSCRLCGTTTSGHDNETFYELTRLAVNASCNRQQKLNYLMKVAQIIVSKSDGCCTNKVYVLEAIKEAEYVFSRIKELIANPES